MYPGKIEQQFIRIKRRHCKVSVNCYTIVEHKHAGKNHKAVVKSALVLIYILAYTPSNATNIAMFAMLARELMSISRAINHQTSEIALFTFFQIRSVFFYYGPNLI